MQAFLVPSGEPPSAHSLGVEDEAVLVMEGSQCIIGFLLRIVLLIYAQQFQCSVLAA